MLSPAITQMSPFLSGKPPADGSAANAAMANRPRASTTMERRSRTRDSPRALVMAQDREWLVRLFESLDFRRVELQVERREGVVEVVRLRSADDRGGDAGLVH